jgi:hypothetical protein
LLEKEVRKGLVQCDGSDSIVVFDKQSNFWVGWYDYWIFRSLLLASLLQALFRCGMGNTLTAWYLQICGQKLEGLASAAELQISGVAGG